MTDQTLQFKQRGIYYFSSGYVTLKKIKHVQHYQVWVWLDNGKNLSLIHQDKYNGQDPKELVKIHVHNVIGKRRLGKLDQ